MFNFLKRHRKFILLLLVFAVLVICETVQARAGGGGGFRSGGSGFSGGGRGSGGSGGSIIMLIWLIFHYPYISIPVIIILLLLFFFGGKSANSSYQNNRIKRGLQRQSIDAQRNNLARLTARDPDFCPDALCNRVKKAFTVIQHAWSDMGMRKARAFITDGIFERFSLQLKINEASGFRNKLSNLEVFRAEIVSVRSDKFFDAIDIRIAAGCIDQYINTKTNKVILGSPNSEPFVEYWTLLRRPGAKTKASPGLLENCCPNCGEPLELLDKTECFSCKAIVNSGEYDWVLSEITQESEYSARANRNIPGLEQMLKDDPAFNVSHMEDRASVIFFRHVAAQFFGDAKYLVKLASSEYLHTNRDEFKALPGGKHSFFADVAVGCVDLVEIIDDHNDNSDFARVMIRWSGHAEKAQVPGFIPPDFDSSRLFVHEMILERQKGVKSSDKNILTSVHCPNCGAPETNSPKAKCEYCNTPLNDGSRDWILHDIRNFTGYPPANDALAHLLTAEEESYYVGNYEYEEGHSIPTPDGEMLVAGAAAIMLADGEIHHEEWELLEEFANNRNITGERLKLIIESVKEGTIQLTLPEDKVMQESFLNAMTTMCLADGSISSAEYRLLYQIGEAMGYSKTDVREIVSQLRKNLLEQAKKL